MTGLSVVVPYRACSTGRRERNLRFVLDRLTGLPLHVVVVEHAADATLSGSFSGSVDYVHVPGARAFSKAVACNAGFRATTSDVVAFIDGDTVLDTRALLGGAERCQRDMDVVRPFGWLVDLDPESSDRAIASGDLTSLMAGEPSDERGPERIPLCGGAFVIRRSAFAQAGGMDEDFEGWGGEDDALSIVLGRLGLRCAIARRSPAIHLWHPRTAGRYADPHYRANIRRLRQWAECPHDEFAARLRAQRKSLTERVPGQA